MDIVFALRRQFYIFLVVFLITRRNRNKNNHRKNGNIYATIRQSSLKTLNSDKKMHRFSCWRSEILQSRFFFLLIFRAFEVRILSQLKRLQKPRHFLLIQILHFCCESEKNYCRNLTISIITIWTKCNFKNIQELVFLFFLVSFMDGNFMINFYQRSK